MVGALDRDETGASLALISDLREESGPNFPLKVARIYRASEAKSMRKNERGQPADSGKSRLISKSFIDPLKWLLINRVSPLDLVQGCRMPTQATVPRSPFPDSFHWSTTGDKRFLPVWRFVAEMGVPSRSVSSTIRETTKSFASRVL